MRNAKTKINGLLLVVPLFLQSVLSPYLAVAAPGTPQTRKFIVTAYYSPLPNQDRYLRGSYEADIRLNGNGTH